MDRLPRWADVALVPLISLLLAAIISALVLLSIGQSPVEAFDVMVDGALGSAYGFLQGAWPFGLVEAVWALVALRRWRITPIAEA